MRDYSAAQLLDQNRKRVAGMGLDRQAGEALLANRNYTPLDMTSMVIALETVKVDGRADFLRRAAGVNKREAAYFNRRYAEMVADLHARNGSVASFVSLGEFPFNQLRDGSVIGLWPVDALSWTEGTRKALGNAGRRGQTRQSQPRRIADHRTGHAARETGAQGTRLHIGREFQALLVNAGCESSRGARVKRAAAQKGLASLGQNRA